MANDLLTADIIAKAAVAVLDNNCVMSNLVYRGYEEDFAKNINGYTVGDTVSVRRPADFTVRSGNVAAAQNVSEGKFNISVDTQEGVDFQFSSTDLTLNIKDLTERAIKPAMVQLANSIDRKLLGLYKDVWNWVGTPGASPGAKIDSFADFALAPERLDLGAVPLDGRYGVLSPRDEYGMLGSQTALYMQDVAKSAYRESNLGKIAGVDTYASQNVQTHTCGTRDDSTPLTRGTSNTTTWELSKNTGTMDLSTDGWDNSATIEQGMVFTIADVYAVNPVTKAKLPHLQQFVVRSAVTAAASSANETVITISPPIITSGAHQTVDAAPGNDKAIIPVGAASGGYAQNMVFRKNAFSLVMVPMVTPPGAKEVAHQSYKGLTVRVIPVYDGINDNSLWRLDVLYGVKTIDARQATRVSGTA